METFCRWYLPDLGIWYKPIILTSGLLNSINPSIHLYSSLKKHRTQSSCCLFLTSLAKKPHRTLGHPGYRKPTHYDRYFNSRPFHYLGIKTSACNILSRQALSIGHADSLFSQIQHLNDVLKAQWIPYCIYITNSSPPEDFWTNLMSACFRYI